MFVSLLIEITDRSWRYLSFPKSFCDILYAADGYPGQIHFDQSFFDGAFPAFIAFDDGCLKLDATTEEVARFAQDNNLSYDNVYYIHKLFQLMDEKKRRHIVEMMLNLSRLPMKHPCTFDDFDFTRFHGHEADELENLQTLLMLESRQNLLLVGPQGVGKTHLTMAVGHKYCEKGLKTYFLKASELNDKFTAALQDGQREK
jgi:DNA replication protein DnaC